jgi:hypothetical protein
LLLCGRSKTAAPPRHCERLKFFHLRAAKTAKNSTEKNLLNHIERIENIASEQINLE